jgi:prolyl 4-hydroxylase
MSTAASLPDVRRHLLAHPGSSDLSRGGLELIVVRDFLDEAECAGLRDIIDGTRMPSPILGDHPDKLYRSSETCNLAPFDPLIIQVEVKLARLFPIDQSHGETIQGQRYAVGQEYKPHFDFFATDQAYWPEQEKIGGQRTWTGMVFLNQVEAGGQTHFPEVGLTITPRLGYLLAWNNRTPDGGCNMRSLHQAKPVQAGTKYIITKWYRERKWG